MPEEVMTIGPDEERLESVHTEEEETPAASSTEDKTNEEEESPSDDKQDEEKIPFHKHPRWIAKQREIEDLKAQLEEVKGAIESRDESDEDEIVEIPKWFVDLYGEDPEAYQAYLIAEEEREKEREERLLTRISRQKEEESEKEQQQQQWVTDQLESLHAEGEEFDDNALMKVMVKYAPSDEDGNLDFNKGLDILKNIQGGSAKPDATAAKKRIASDTTPSGGEIGSQDVATSETFRKNRPW